MSVLAQRRLEEQERRAARPEAEDLLALEHAPVELVDLLAADQHEAVGRGEPAEDRDLGRRIADLHVDRGLRADQRDVGAVGQERRQRLVAAESGRQRLLDADLLEVALGDRHIGRRVEHRAHDLVVADLHRRLALRERGERRGDGERAEGGEPAFEGAAAIEHGDPRLEMHGGNVGRARNPAREKLNTDAGAWHHYRASRSSAYQDGFSG